MIDVAIIAGLVYLTAPATPAPEQYLATAYSFPGEQLQWRGFDNWVKPQFCFERCGTVPGQPNVLLGGMSVQTAADWQLTVWRREGDRWVQVVHCNNFFTGPHCWNRP